MVEAILLGIAQDGGVPQAGCTCELCTHAHADPTARKWAASLGLISHQTRKFWLIDATPDFREQLFYLQQAYPKFQLGGILLTHAHMGHYSGLLHLGPEAWNTQAMPVYASPQMIAYLSRNQPWRQLTFRGNIHLHPIMPDETLALTPDLKVSPVRVPHRDEWSDTLAFVVQGAERKLFYCPDIDAWTAWDENVADFAAEMDVALVDATFFSADELPARDRAEIPHPLVIDTVARLAHVDCEVMLIHMNHTNPLHKPGAERAWLEKQGVGVGERGQRWVLG